MVAVVSLGPMLGVGEPERGSDCNWYCWVDSQVGGVLHMISLCAVCTAAGKLRAGDYGHRATLDQRML